MSAKTSDASGIDWDVHAPPDSPFISDPALAEGLAIPTAYVRRMEEAQRLYAVHDAQQGMLSYAYKRATWAVGMQCGWLGVGGWLAVRGYRYADPVQSLASGFTSNRVLCRACTPLAMLGITMFTVTAVQLPSDVQRLLAAREAWSAEELQKASALAMRMEAYCEGQAAMDQLKGEESRAFEAGMAETAKTSK
ncbi:hypothetical protein DQ04_00901050 [Trypanosoma grayi]|uniref:hypothetical protein n=1 Tax=Trypanosoma grayi TaxID=71804 RepID=UPI0004F4ADDD|nr:hypothetical protein DQ04_00901050 [Trypanosoma grayi]KEG13603.1 hypothetical protein DQ04_00901050 [Trypanosoma grayi]